MYPTILLALLSLTGPSEPGADADQPASADRGAAVRLVDLTGDGLRDKLYLGVDGSLRVAVHVAARSYEPIGQDLPRVLVADVLVDDLDGDGLLDLYLVSPHANVALRGDNTGHFVEATESLGLTNSGWGVSVERLDLDDDGLDDVLLHNRHGDVIFWATGDGFQRDGDTPDVALPSGDPDASLWALEVLVAQSAELLSLDPQQQIMLSMDEAGRPRVTLGSAASPRHGIPAPTGGPLPPAENAVLGAVTPAGPAVPIPVLTPEAAEILSHQSIVYLDDGSGNLATKTIRMTGVNLQIVNGSGTTTGAVDGRGNLIVGYNELRVAGNDVRTGSHNLIIGRRHNYSSFGGLVAGDENMVAAPHASVSGGRQNRAIHVGASVSGGHRNIAQSAYSTVSGGRDNIASNIASSISGGRENSADGVESSISGGTLNTASAVASSVSGGQDNTASGDNSSVSGGRRNWARGGADSISGGYRNSALGPHGTVSGGCHNAAGTSASVSGGCTNLAYGAYASVSGGWRNTAFGEFSSISGGTSNRAQGTSSSISGGIQNTATGGNAWASGGRLNQASGESACVLGGYQNRASGWRANVSGGEFNSASGQHSSVTGGHDNTASGFSSSVSGGNTRTASGTDDWVAGTLLEDS